MSDIVFVKKSEDPDYHYCLGVVYTAGQVDTDFDSMTVQDVTKMAHDFIACGKVKQIDSYHNHLPTGAEVVESFVARKGDPDFPENSWVLGIRFNDPDLWDKVSKGELNGFSVDMLVNKVPKVVDVTMVMSATGDTEMSTAKDVSSHKHVYWVEFDAAGRVVFGITDEVDGHTHKILGTTATEMDKSKTHSHRFEI